MRNGNVLGWLTWDKEDDHWGQEGLGTERGECEREVTFNVKVEATEHDGKQRDGKQVGDPSC